jgi:membrane protein DedA with SNARE-associated domain
MVALESMGLLLPGETILVLAGVYCGAGGDLSIWGVVGAAIAGAVLGDNAGFWLGREFGYPLLLKCSRYIGLTDTRIKLAQYLFLRHGGKVVFFGRFVALLRILAAFLAGINRMNWGRFLLANAGGGILWASIFGFGAYVFGKGIEKLGTTLGLVAFVLAAFGLFVVRYFVQRHEVALQVAAARALTVPLRANR